MRDIWKMLNECAPGWTKQEADHYYRIEYEGKRYLNLPTGQHGKKPGRGEIEKKHVKDLAETLGILDCAKKVLPILGPPRKKR